MKKILLLLLFLLSTGIVYAWDGDGHETLAKWVCNDFADCKKCMANITYGSTYPDHVLKDTANHHFYNPTTCVPSSNYTCPTKYDDIALRKTDEWLVKSTQDIGCDKWFDIAVASHYFFDSKVIWHQVKNETSYCHSDFEEKVGVKLKSGATNWTVCKCGQCIGYDSFPVFAEEFETKIINTKPQQQPQSTETQNQTRKDSIPTESKQIIQIPNPVVQENSTITNKTETTELPRQTNAPASVNQTITGQAAAKPDTPDNIWAIILAIVIVVVIIILIWFFMSRRKK